MSQTLKCHNKITSFGQTGIRYSYNQHFGSQKWSKHDFSILKKFFWRNFQLIFWYINVSCNNSNKVPLKLWQRHSSKKLPRGTNISLLYQKFAYCFCEEKFERYGDVGYYLRWHCVYLLHLSWRIWFNFFFEFMYKCPAVIWRLFGAIIATFCVFSESKTTF